MNMTETAPLEQIVQELQIVAQQLVSVQTQVRELETTIEHLSTQISGNSVFQQVGPLLVEVDDLELKTCGNEASRRRLHNGIYFS